ncbi:MAG: response regulator transcription factor, partial [Thermoleophilia bacterium]|nr:response regulator transcription factor [Thermoleophilia bacterium]
SSSHFAEQTGRGFNRVGALKTRCGAADSEGVDAAEVNAILDRYRDHARRFDEAAARRSAQEHPATATFPAEGRRRLEQKLTPREVEVLQLVAQGLANREIGHRLYLSEETVKSHVRHLLAKLQARSRAHAVAVGMRRGFIA